MDQVLQSGLTMLPWAPISAVSQKDLPGVIARLEQRLKTEAEPAMAAEFWTGIKVLLGLRYQADFVEHLLQGVRAMKDSTTYQAILEEGRQEGIPVGARQILFGIGKRRFGKGPSPEQQTVIKAITNLERPEELVLCAEQVGSWAELLE